MTVTFNNLRSAKVLVNQTKMLYPFAAPDIKGTENNLEVLYNNKKISVEKISW